MKQLLLISLFVITIFSSGKAITDDIAEKKNQAKELFRQRADKQKLEQGIKLLDEIASGNGDYESAVPLSRARYLNSKHPHHSLQVSKFSNFVFDNHTI